MNILSGEVDRDEQKANVRVNRVEDMIYISFYNNMKMASIFEEDYEVAIQWLVDAGMIYKVHIVSKPAMPLKSYIDLSAFKLYMIDIGLMGAMSELDIESVLLGNELFVEFKGALTEQYVLQQIVANTDYTLYYYSGEKSTYEMDYIIQKQSVIPIEVKAEQNPKSKSLKVYCDKYKPNEAIRTSMSNYFEQSWMKNIPLWAIGAI